jgi:hypothetical protein
LSAKRGDLYEGIETESFDGRRLHELLISAKACVESRPLQRLGDVGGNAPRLVAGEDVRRRASSGLILEIGVDERLPVGVADDLAGVGLLDRPWRRKAAGRHQRLRLLLSGRAGEVDRPPWHAR